MIPARISDPVLGDRGEVFGNGKQAGGIFTRVFGPTQGPVLVLVDVIEGQVPQSQRDLYQEIEAWYPIGVREVFEAVRHEVERDEVLMKWLPPEQIPNRLELKTLNIRIPFTPPAKAVLEYRFDPDKPVWYVRIGENFHVEWCGLGD